MLHGIKINRTPTEVMLETLEKSNFYFYLTGSRYFGDFNESSDFDFFCEQNSDCIAFLKKYGFNFETHSYEGNITSGVMKHNSLPIHIQIVCDLGVKLKMQQLLYNSEVLSKRVDKFTAKKLWDFAYHIAMGGM